MSTKPTSQTWTALEDLPGAELVDGFCPWTEYGEVLGFNEKWVDGDFNPTGVNPCFCDESGVWTISVWCGQCDEYHTKSTDPTQNPSHYTSIETPTHIMLKPQPPINGNSN